MNNKTVILQYAEKIKVEADNNFFNKYLQWIDFEIPTHSCIDT